MNSACGATAEHTQARQCQTDPLGVVMRIPTLGCLLLTFVAKIALSDSPDSPADIGSRRQLFVDQQLVEKMVGVRQLLHHPIPRQVAIKPEHLWEKYGVSYMVTFRDGGRYRAWYRVDAAPFGKAPRRAMTAYAESTDGIHWCKPSLGVIEYDGSRDNNLVWDGAAANMAPFRDDNNHARRLQR